MAKIIYNSRLAKWLTPLGTCHTITLAWWILTEKSKEEVNVELVRHESTHVEQYSGWFCMGVLLYFIGLLTMRLPLWWLIPLTQSFYIWYGIEWAIRVIIGKCHMDKYVLQNAYKGVAFEREAVAMELSDKIDDVDLFTFIKYY